MQLTKKIIAIALVLIMILSFAACGKKEEAAPSTGGNTSTGTKTDAGTFQLEGVTYSYADFPKSDLVIAKLNGDSMNAWRSAMMKAWEDCCTEMKAAGLIKDFYTYNVNGNEEMIAAFNDCINKGVNVICAQASGAVYGPIVQTCLDQGIKVVNSGDAGIPELMCKDFVALNGDNDEYMRGPVEYMCSAMGYEGKIIHLYGLEGGWDGGEIRKEAVREVIGKYPKMEIIHGEPCTWSNSQANAAMATLLSAYGDELGGNKVGVVGEDVGLGVLQAYQAAGVEFPVLLGDYTIGFMREWAKNPDLISVCNCSAADYTYTFAHVAYLMGIGREFDEEACKDLRGNKWNIVTPMPCVVVKEYNENDEWIKNLLPTTEVRLLDDVLKWADENNLSDNDCILGHQSLAEVAETYFK